MTNLIESNRIEFNVINFNSSFIEWQFYLAKDLT